MTDRATMELRWFDFDRAGKSLRISSEEFGGRFPQEIAITSHHTGKVEVFVPDQQAALANEFWDGEELHYIPIQPLPNVAKLVVYHAY